MSPQPCSHHSDLAWLFGESEALMGYRSSFDSMIEALKGCGGTVTRDDAGGLVNSSQLSIANEDTMIEALDERRTMSRLGAATRDRRIMRAFRSLTPRCKGVLAAFYEPRQLPRDVVRVLGDVGRLAHLTATAKGVKGYSMAWLERACSPRAPDARAVQIKTEATSMLDSARAAYERAAQGDTVASLRAALSHAVSV